MGIKHRSTRPLEAQKSLSQIAAELRACRNCELYANGTRPVCGEGPGGAAIALVGEQPGDMEERTGKPFVGPAGALLDKALAAAGVTRGRVYVTNAVKHFHFGERGRMRLHKRPRTVHVKACKPWLLAEISVIRPRALVLLGTTAASALLGKDFRLTQQRGTFLNSNLAPVVLATWHPSLALRAPDSETRARIVAEITADLRSVAQKLAALAKS